MSFSFKPNLFPKLFALVLVFVSLVYCDNFYPGQNYTCQYFNVEQPEMRCTVNNTEESFFAQNLDPPLTLKWWYHLIICLCLVCIAGMMSGLTMGLMSLDLMNLKILGKSGTTEQRRYAKGILPLVKRHHLLLVTLLLSNAAAMEALPIFLEQLVSPVVAIICSVTLVLAFGEIIPQAICTRYGLAIGYYLRYMVWALIGVEFIIAWPISKLLDCLIGHEGLSFLRRAELSELVQQHGVKRDEEEADSGEERGPLLEDEVRIIRGALSLREKSCTEKVYTPLHQVFSLELNTVLDQNALLKISEKRHSRIPIYRKHPSHIIGIILTKSLIHISATDRININSLELTQLPRVTTETPLYTLLNQFQKGKSHMALVLDPKDNLTVKGIVTLEDVIEELLESEILDESDLIRGAKRRGKHSLDIGPNHPLNENSSLSTASTIGPNPRQHDLGSVNPNHQQHDLGSVGSPKHRQHMGVSLPSQQNLAPRSNPKNQQHDLPGSLVPNNLGVQTSMPKSVNSFSTPSIQ